jgi:hypothetical protein
MTNVPDLSKLHLAPKKNLPEPEAVEVYPSEIGKVKSVLQQLESAFVKKAVDDPLEAAEAFNQMAANLFGEIGFIVEVEWMEAKENPFGPTKMYVPNVSIAGRTRKETEVDHDRMQHDIVHGLADGVKGYIREDGTEHEDPIKKIIT